MDDIVPVANTQNTIRPIRPEYGAALVTPDIQDYKTQLKGQTSEYGIFSQNSALYDGLKISPAGTWTRKALNGSLNSLTRYKPTQEEFKQIAQGTGWDSQDMQWVLSGASSMEQVRGNMDILAQNRRIQEQFNNSSWYMSLVGGVGQMLGNPVDMGLAAASFAIPPLGAAGALAKAGSIGAKVATAAEKLGPKTTMALRVAGNTAAGVASNQLQGSVSGIDHNVWGDIASMLLLTTGFQSLGKTSKALRNTRNRVAIAHDQILKNGQVSPQLLGTFTQRIAKATIPYAKKANDIRQQLTSGLSSFQFRKKLQLLTQSPDQKTAALASKFTHFEAGVRSQKGQTGISKQFVNNGKQTISQKDGVYMPDDQQTVLKGSGRTTLFQEVRNLSLTTQWSRDWLPNAVDNVSKRYNRQLVNDFLYKKIQGSDTSSFGRMNQDPDLLKIAKKLEQGYDMQGKRLVYHELVDNIFSFKKYMPMIIDQYKMSKFIRTRFGLGEQNQIRSGQYLKYYLYNGVFNDAKTMQNFKQIYNQQLDQLIQKQKKNALKQGIEYQPPNWMIKKQGNQYDVALNQYVLNQAKAASYGYRDQNRSANHKDNFDDSAVSFSFRKKRLPWNTAYKDSSGFSLDSLRADVVDATQKYIKRTNGLIADKRVFNKDFAEVTKQIDQAANRQNRANAREPRAGDSTRQTLDVLHRRAYGMALDPKNADYSYSDAIADMLRNITYGAYGTLMGVLSYGEVATAIQAYGASVLLKMMPGAQKIFNRFARNDFTKEQWSTLKQYLVGREAAQRLNIHQIMRAQGQRYKDLNPYMAKAVGISRVVADYSPASFVMNYTNETIIDTIQGEFLREFAKRAYQATYKKKGFITKQNLQRLDIPQKDLLYTFKAFKRYTYTDQDGIIRLKDNFQQFAGDDKAMYVMRRLINYVAQETMQKRQLQDVFTWQVKNNPIMALALQFKTFALQSYNKRFVKIMNRAQDEGALGVTNNYLISCVLTAAVTSAQAYLRTLGMSQEDRDKYIKNVFGVDLQNGLDRDGVESILFNSMFNRNPYTAALTLVPNALGIGTGAKTTASTSVLDEQDDTGFIRGVDVAKTFSDMFPSLRVLGGLTYGATGTYNLANDYITDQYDYKQKRDTVRQLNKAIGILPTVPGATNILKGYMKDSLENYQYGY